MQKRFALLFSQFIEMINFWAVIGILIIACLLTMVSLAVFGLGRSKGPPGIQSTAILNVIPAGSMTPISNLTSGFSPVEADQTPTPSAPGIVIVGSYVQVAGTAGNGLRLRDQPGLNSKTLLLGREAEVFRVDDGPIDLDGYTWWYLVGPFDQTRRGWGVADFLNAVQEPN